MHVRLNGIQREYSDSLRKIYRCVVGYCFKAIMVYIDDILGHSKGPSMKHEQLVGNILNVLGV